VNCLAFSRDGKYLASGGTFPITMLIYLDLICLTSSGDDEAVRIWDLSSKAKPHVLQDRLQRWGQITCLKWILAGSSENGELICFGTG